MKVRISFWNSRKRKSKMQCSQCCFPFPFNYEYQEKKHGNISSRNCAFWTQKAAPTLTASSPASINALKQCIKHKYTIYLLKYLQCLETSVLCQGNSNTQHNIGNKIWKQIPRFIPHYNCCIYDLSKRDLKKVGYSPQSWTIQTLIKWQQTAAIKKILLHLQLKIPIFFSEKKVY